MITNKVQTFRLNIMSSQQNYMIIQEKHSQMTLHFVLPTYTSYYWVLNTPDHTKAQIKMANHNQIECLIKCYLHVG